MGDLTRAESRAETEERLRHGSSFGAAAAAYAEHRPGYAEAAVRWALEPLSTSSIRAGASRAGSIRAGSIRVLDLGAGTGKLTTTLVGLGAEVTAVEPHPDMLAELRRELPSVRSLPGSAEGIPLPDGGADAVVVGQAMHWFDLNRAMPEIARILVPGGILAAMWNVDDDRVGWVATLAQISKRKSSVTLLTWRDELGRFRRERLDAAGSGLFEAAEVGEFEHGQRRTAESLLATIATHSHLLTLDDLERAALLNQVGEFLHGCPETSNGEFVLPMATVVLRARRT